MFSFIKEHFFDVFSSEQVESVQDGDIIQPMAFIGEFVEIIKALITEHNFAYIVNALWLLSHLLKDLKGNY